ncbi:MAG: S41 family peptidase [Candidatus Endonucleobacter bathymodioli]|uniref:S41 family peptidase n=1 Tax=Candidatus Endonucleibacter bathymodioli TaxID=539814 RepID=A0AA90SN39_9GAMM|nr:S41 family peptidase [Candidatus Endonucleobacter bathymodioli]
MTITSRFHHLFWAAMVIMSFSYGTLGWTKDRHNGTDPAFVAQDKDVAEEKADEQEKGRLPLEELRIFAEVMQRIKSAYVEEVDDKTLLESAIKGMLSDLDPHSAYLQPKDFKKLGDSTSGKFGGLGMEVSMEDGYVKVVSPIDDTPAHKAGIQAGDLIIKLDDSSVKGFTLSQAVEKMRGKAGEVIKLTIVRDGSPQPFELSIKRDIIKVLSVKTATLEDGYGYIRISQFQTNTDKELQKELKKLQQQQKTNTLKGIILDLRNNPGGVLQSAVGVVDTFLKDGLIVYTKGRFANSEFRFHATNNDPSGGAPLVVLINNGSASASEIVAGALQDNHRALLLGDTSFGKGSVQTVLPLSIDSERGLKLTTALYYTPSGRSIQAEGIKPDIDMPQAKITPLKEEFILKEADLNGHLVNGNDAKKSSQKQVSEKRLSADDSKDKSEKLLGQDYQLSQALNILKGMYLQQSPGKGENSAEAPSTVSSK